MRLPALVVAALLASAGPALAQSQANPNGVTVAEAKAWLTAAGGEVSEPELATGRTILRVADNLPWALNFFACGSGLCDDVQFSASFTGPITEAQATEWNRENRYVKAVWIAPTTPGGEATVMAQYDLVLTGTGPDQLSTATSIWLQQLGLFARTMSQGATAR